MPHSTLRSSNRGRPGRLGLRLTCGNSGAIRSHRPSSTSQGRRVVVFLSAVSHLRAHQRKLIHTHSRRPATPLLLGVLSRTLEEPRLGTPTPSCPNSVTRPS